MVQVPEALSWWVVVLRPFDMVIQIFVPHSEDAQEGLMILVAQPCLIWPIIALVLLFF